MGIVYRAFDPLLERDLAIKVLPPKKLSQEMLERFLREAKAVAKLDSLNIVKIFDIGKQPDGEYEINYIVMEFVKGVNLGERFEGKPTSVEALEERLELFDQILDAMEYAHTKGVIHRDLKPDNVMVTASDRAKIMDFGLAFFAGSHSLTQANQVMGTVAYFSPEQAAARADVDHRADLYSLGVIMFELMTGRLPFLAEHPVHMMKQVLHDEPPLPSSFNKLVSSALDAICLRCLRKEPADRFGTVGEFRQALRLARLAPRSSRLPSASSAEKKAEPAKKAIPERPTGQSTIAKSGPPPVPDSLPSRPLTPTVAKPVIPPVAKPVIPPVAKPVTPPVAKPISREPASEVSLDISALLGTSVDPMQTESTQKTIHQKTTQRHHQPESIRSLHPALASTDWQIEVGQGKSDEAQVEPDEPEPPRADPTRPKIVGPGIFCQCGAENPPEVDVCYECGEEIRPSIHIIRQDADTHYRNAMTALSRGHLNEARQEFLSALEKNPEFGEVYLELGKVELSLGFFEEAHDHLEASLNYLSSRYETLITLADLYQQVEQPDDVIACLQDILDDHTEDTAVRCRLALLYCQLDKIDRAVSTYRMALKYEPDNLSANRQLGLLFAAEGAEDEAIHYLEIVCRLDPNDGQSRGLLGRLYRSRGQLRQAEDAFARALELRPRDPDVRVEMSHLYRQQGRLDKAAEILERTLERSEGHLAASRQLAEIRLEAGDLQGAERSLREAIEFHPEDDRLHRQLGEVYLMLGRLDGALTCFEKVVDLRPECADMHNRLGRLYLKKNYDEKSVKEYTEAVSLHPLEPSYREDLGMAYYVSGKLPEAAAELHKATRLDGRNSDYFKALGFIYDEMGTPDEAVEYFKYAIHLDPKDARTLAALARARTKQGLANAAIDLYRQALSIEPGLTVLHLSLARALAAAGRNSEAVRSFQNFAETMGDEDDTQLLSSVFLEMGQSLFDSGDTGQAAEVFQAALSHPENQAQARVGLARVSLSRSDFKAAKSHLEQALRLEPRYAEAWHVWSMLAAEEGDWTEAVRRMEKAVQLRSDDPELWIQLGRCYRKAGRTSEADRTFAKACERFPDQEARFLWLRGRLAVRQKDWTFAYELLSRSVKLAPASWRVYEDLAQTCIGLQNWQLAEDNIEKAAQLAPSDRKSSILRLLEKIPDY